MPDTRDQLKGLRDQLATARSERTQLKRQRDDVKGKMAEVDFTANADIMKDPSFIEAQEIVKNLGMCDDKIANLEAGEATIMKLLGQDPTAVRGNGQNGNGERSIGWNGARLLAESPGYENLRDNLMHSQNKFGTVEIGKVCTREELLPFLNPRLGAALPTAPAATVGTDQGVVVPDTRGVYPPALKPITLLDLIPSGTTDSNIIQYVQVAAIPGYAAEVAELTLKPNEGLAFTDATAPVRTIAGFIKLARQALEDMAALATLVNTLLPYDVRRRLESEILAGNGVGQNLLGIMNTAGIGAPASVAGDTNADAILRAMTTVILSDGDPTFVTLNPITWQDMAIAKAAGSGEYMFQFPGGMQSAYAARTIWGLTVTSNRIVPPQNPLVGDSAGATVLVREGVNIRTSDSDQDDFVNNRVTILAETRVAFPVWRPSAFAVATVPQYT